MGERFRQSADSYMKPLQNSIFNGCCFVGECRSFLKTQKLIERENFPLLAVFCGVVDGRSFARQRARSLRPPPPSSVHRWWRQTVRPMGRVPFGGFCRQIAAARRFSYRNAPNSGKFGRARFFCHIKGNLNFWGLIELTMAGSHVLIIVLLFSHLSVGAKYPQSWRTPPRGSGFAPRRGIGRSTFR